MYVNMWGIGVSGGKGGIGGIGSAGEKVVLGSAEEKARRSWRAE